MRKLFKQQGYITTEQMKQYLITWKTEKQGIIP
jgi:hypothetical protein